MSPKDFGSSICSFDIPTPLSLTESSRAPSFSIRETATSVAWACLAMFVRVSWKMRKMHVDRSGLRTMCSGSTVSRCLIPVRL